MRSRKKTTVTLLGVDYHSQMGRRRKTVVASSQRETPVEVVESYLDSD